MSAVTADCWEMQKAEARLREVAFHVAYHHVYAGVADHTLRFGYALIHSTQPILDQQVFREWWQFTRGFPLLSSLEKAKRAGKVVPPRIRGLVEAWQRAREMRAVDDIETKDGRRRATPRHAEE